MSEEEKSPKQEPKASGFTSFWKELRRRKVVRVAMVYAVVGWLVIQIAVSTFPRLTIPGWAESLVIMLVVLGFPISLVVAWAFELTPEGIKADAGVGAGESVAPAKGQKLNYVTLGLVVLVLTFLIVDRYLFNSESAGAKSVNVALPASGETVRFTITLPDSLEFPLGRGLAVSPDGQNIVFTALREASSLHQLFRRPIDQLDLIELTEGAYPFFSPDGLSVGFGADSGLQQMPLTGGPAQRLAAMNRESRGIRGTDWGEDGEIVFGRAPGLVKVSASGGDPLVLASSDGLYEYWYPQVLPETGAILFTYSIPGPDAGELQLLFPETGERRTLLDNAVAGRVLDSGHLVFIRDRGIWAAPFDRDRLELAGNPVHVQEGVLVELGGVVQYAVSDNGTLIYRSQSPNVISEGTLILMDRQGSAENVPEPPNRYAHPRFSPDGTRIAVEIQADGLSNIFIYELANRQLRRLTPNGGAVPLWTPDGSQITFVVEGELWNIASDFSEEPQRLSADSEEPRSLGPYTWSPDGRVLVWLAGSLAFQFTLMEEDEVEYDLLLNKSAALNRPNPLFSPDGDWLSWQSHEDGSWDTPTINVQPYPLGAGLTQKITQGDGGSAVWARGGNEMFFANDGRLWAVGIETKPTLSWQDPVALFEMPWPVQVDSFVNYDITPDGQRFVFIKPLEDRVDEQSREIQVVLNWVEELNRLVPATKDEG
jgi:serine/threonine-protein kinase